MVEGRGECRDILTLKEEHHKVMKAAGCDIDRMVAFRHDIH